MADLGLYALRLGLLLCALGVGAGIYAGLTRREEWTRVSERSLLLVFGACSFAMLALFWALANNDFSLAYVASHSARTMPLHYRLGALWGGQAGSLLLWGWMLTAYGAVAIFGNKSQMVIDPSEDKLRTEFDGVQRSFVPMHAVVRIDEVEKEGVAKIKDATGDKITPFPMPLPKDGPKP